MSAGPNPHDHDEPESHFDFETLQDLSVDDVLGLPDDRREGFEEFDNYHEVERYWVYRPYAYISILYNPDDENYVYYIVEPELDEYEELLKKELSDRLKDRLMTEDIDGDDGRHNDLKAKLSRREDVLLREAIDVANDYGVGVGQESLHKVLYYVERDFVKYGKIEPIMQDPRIEDISCNGYGVPVFVFHRNRKDLETNLRYESPEDLNNFVIRLAQRSGKHISAAEPMVDASLPDGSRANLSLGDDVTTRGSTFTIRKFRDEPLTPVDLIELGTFNLEQMSYLWLAIENDMSLIFAGGTASGKTTSMNAVSLFIPPKQKVVSIEDTREVTLPHENWVPSVTREAFGATGEGSDGNEVDMYSLLESALRQRPEYLLVGEVRGEEARTLFQAMSTGHTTYSTLHAEDVRSVFQRLKNPPIEVPAQMLRALDIVSIQEQTQVDGQRVRRNNVIAEVLDLNEQGDVEYNPYFTREPRTDEYMEDTGSSVVIAEVAQKRGWTEQRAHEERAKRERVLEYLLEKDIHDYVDVTRTIQAFMVDPEWVLEEIENDTLDPSKFADMESIS